MDSGKKKIRRVKTTSTRPQNNPGWPRKTTERKRIEQTARLQWTEWVMLIKHRCLTSMTILLAY